MPSNVGTQTVTLKWLTEAASRKVNKRYHEVRPTGIYKGGYLSAVDATNITISPLVCEIADDDLGYQVRVETTSTVTITEATLAGKYIVLRWDYTGSSTVDYMALLALAVGNIRSDDLIIGYCNSASDFDYGRSGYRRSNPVTHSHHLRVDPPDSVAMAGAPMKVRVRDGRIQTHTENVDIDDQPTPSSFTTPASGTEYGLVYISGDGVVQIVDNDGETSIPNFEGKTVLAIITITDSDTIITRSMIKDVRQFIGKGRKEDLYLTSRNSDTQVSRSGGNYITVNIGTPTKQNGIDVSSNKITLLAGRKYSLNYSIVFADSSSNLGDPTFSARFSEVSGDFSWNLEIITQIGFEVPKDNLNGTTMGISLSSIIIPSEDTVILLEAHTENSTQRAYMTDVIVNIFTID